MASGRSARLPPTPTQHSNLRHIVDASMNSGYANDSNTESSDTINALGPDLAVATSQVLDSLSERERQIILDVLNRDEELRQKDTARIV